MIKMLHINTIIIINRHLTCTRDENGGENTKLENNKVSEVRDEAQWTNISWVYVWGVLYHGSHIIFQDKVYKI